MSRSDAYIAFLRKYTDHVPDALLWLLGYCGYVHAIDDIIDNDIPGDKNRSEFILRTFEFAAVVYGNKFYIDNINALYPLIKLASNTYMDSVQLEGQPEKWKKACADILRQNCNEVFLAVIEIISGYDMRRKASIELRELTFYVHHDELGNPI